MVLALALAVPVHAQSSTWSGTVALSSQLIDRGLAISPATPILQGDVSWTSASGWVLGASAATELRSPGKGSEALAQVAHYWTFTDDWRMQAGVIYYSYPGNARGHPFDRVETGVHWLYRDVLSAGLSAMTLTRGSDHDPRGAADIDFHWPLPRHFAFSAGLGVAQPLLGAERDRYGYDNGYRIYRHLHPSSYYGYGHLGLAWAYGRWQVELDRVFTDPDIRRQRYQVAAPWVATLSWSF